MREGSFVRKVVFVMLVVLSVGLLSSVAGASANTGIQPFSSNGGIQPFSTNGGIQPFGADFRPW